MATRPQGFALVLVPVYFIKHSVSCYIYYIHCKFDGRVAIAPGTNWKRVIMIIINYNTWPRYIVVHTCIYTSGKVSHTDTAILCSC